MLNKPIVYVDLDDTAANYTEQYYKYMELYPSHKYPQSNLGFFSSLEPMDGFLESWNLLSQFYDMRILTRPSVENLNSYTEKAIWVRDNLGAEALEKLNLVPNKGLMIGDYLIDDFDKNGQKEFKGEFIQFGTEIFKNWSMVTDYLLSKI